MAKNIVGDQKSLVAASNGEIGVFSVSGVVTARTARRIAKRCADWLDAFGGMAPVVNYQGALLALTPKQLCAAVTGMFDAGGVGGKPVALLVSAEQVSYSHEYAWLMGQHGLLRETFQDLDAARLWSLQQGQIWCQLPAAAARSSSRAFAGTAVSALPQTWQRTLHQAPAMLM